ncbi:hypothetical protein [Catenuloplanes atrovinosus]|uniref:Fibronectin type-III domain-containing protein n=1 Tax=Catenuloplanes atrovinosus TaxID=137266 RepID=A0AAE3YTU8_9ACTN|nr:hypothetical protein [Catenuloplanes atrovinosus]MDR7279112.1 hypothetical protein [Catenuloplanes atrovinosus]
MFDQDEYRRTVLDPARADRNTPPADLFLRYAMAADRPPRTEQFTAHVEAVAKYWQSLTQRIAYRRLAETLLVAHRTLRQAGKLTLEHFAAERDRWTAEIGRKLEEAVDDLAAAGPVVFAEHVAAVAARLGGATAEAGLRDHLRRRRVRVVDELWPLPAGPHPKSRDLQAATTMLGLRLSIDAVAGEERVRQGFTLRRGLCVGGAPLTGAQIREAKSRAERRAQDERKTATDNVLTILQNAEQDGTLGALVLWELLEAVRPAAELPGATVRRVAREAAQLGLDRDEADELALAVLAAGRDSGSRRGPAAEVEALLGSGALRAAQRLLTSLPAEAAGDLPDRIREVAARVSDLAARAHTEAAAGRTEHAAELLVAATREASDDTDLAGRLRALAPPPPPSVRAGAVMDRVSVGWDPSPARTGGISYQVVRTRGRAAGAAADGDVVGGTESNEIVDRAPPAGDDLWYTVFARRADGAWSAGASTGPVTLLPDVTALTATAGETDVRVTWTVRSDATGVAVTRLPGGARVPEVARTGFAEKGLPSGRECRYLVRVVYAGAGGTPVTSPGVTVTVTPQPPPAEVRDLAVVPLPGQSADRLRLAWTRPPGGEVVLRSAPHRPRWQPGAELAATELSTYGDELTGHVELGPDGRDGLTVRAPSGRVFVTAFSTGAGRAICGPTIAVTNTAPVTNLRARRVGPRARLSWEWPDGVGLARVRWWPSDAPDRVRESDCWARAYRDDGGFEIAVGVGAAFVSVATVGHGPDEESVGTPVTIRVAGVGVRVTYRFEQRRLPRRTRIVLTSEQTCELPELIVVRTEGRVAPLRADQGTTVARVPSQRLEPGRPLAMDVAAGGGRGPYRLGCFIDDRGGPGSDVVLTGTPGGY